MICNYTENTKVHTDRIRAWKNEHFPLQWYTIAQARHHKNLKHKSPTGRRLATHLMLNNNRWAFPQSMVWGRLGKLKEKLTPACSWVGSTPRGIKHTSKSGLTGLNWSHNCSLSLSLISSVCWMNQRERILTDAVISNDLFYFYFTLF